MKRYFSLLIVLFGCVFSSFASASEWEIKGGDTLWKILAEACQVVPSMEKVRVFARVVGIQTPDHVVIGDRIDVTRGCAALSDSHASLAKVTDMSARITKATEMSAQQGETLRAIQARTVAIDAGAAKLRAKLELPNWNGAVNQVALRLSDERHSSEVNTRIAQGLSSNMEAFVQRSTGAKGHHTFGDPAIFFEEWLWIVAAFCIFIWFSFIRKRGVSEVWASDGSDSSGGMLPSRIPLDFVLSGTENTAPVDSGLQFLGTLEQGLMTLSVPFTWEMELRFYKRMRSIHTRSFWCVVPIFVKGHGYETFECDAEGNRIYVEKPDAFRQSVENSIRLFLDGKSDEGMSGRIMAAIQQKLLRPSE